MLERETKNERKNGAGHGEETSEGKSTKLRDRRKLCGTRNGEIKTGTEEENKSGGALSGERKSSFEVKEKSNGKMRGRKGGRYKGSDNRERYITSRRRAGLGIEGRGGAEGGADKFYCVSSSPAALERFI